MSNRRTFSKEKKLAILKEAQENGVTGTLDKHGIFPVPPIILGRKNTKKWENLALVMG